MVASKGDPRDLLEGQIGELRAHLDNSLFDFAYLVFGFEDLIPSLHGEVCHLLGLWGTGEYKRLMIQVPRGSYKTSLCTIANSLWQITRDPTETIVIFNERMENSKKWLRAIREVVMGSRIFQMVYRDMLPPGIAWDDNRSIPRHWKWGDEEIVFNRPNLGTPEASLTAMGVGTASTGGHWSRVIKDDLVSEEAKGSDAVMQRVREWFDSSLPLEKPPYKGSDLIVCTPWTYGDVYRYVLEKYDYKLYRRSALETGPDGELVSVMPHKWTVEELLREQERDAYYFAAQMQCQPRAGREQSFHPDWLRWGKVVEAGMDGEPAFRIHKGDYDPERSEAVDEMAPQEVPLWMMSKAVMVDPAAAEKNEKLARDPHCVTGIVVLGRDPWGRTFVLDSWGGRRDPLDEILWMLEMADRWGTNRIAIEEVTFSNMYRHFLLQEARRRDQFVTVTPLKPGKYDKETRIRGLIPKFREGMIYFSDAPGVKRFEQEYLEYPYGTTRDLLDAAAYMDEVLRRQETPGEMAERRGRDRWQRAYSRDPVTGYLWPLWMTLATGAGSTLSICVGGTSGTQAGMLPMFSSGGLGAIVSLSIAAAVAIMFTRSTGLSYSTKWVRGMVGRVATAAKRWTCRRLPRTM
jgi:hypothetical protein